LAVTLEQDIAERIAAAKLRLRFDKVVLRLVGHLKAALGDIVPEGQAVIFTVTAPIRHPAKTAAGLEALARNDLAGGEVRDIVYGNHVRLRRLTGLAAAMPKVIGFVHNPDSDSGQILALTEAYLRERS
jgi:hypothetical protein